MNELELKQNSIGFTVTKETPDNQSLSSPKIIFRSDQLPVMALQSQKIRLNTRNHTIMEKEMVSRVLEDGRITKFYYYRLQQIGKSCSLLTIISILIIAIYFDTSFDPSKEFITDILLKVNAFITFVLIICLFCRKLAVIHMQQSQLLVSDSDSIFSNKYLYKLIIEILIVLVQPYWFTEDVYYTQQDQCGSTIYQQKLNHLLCIFQMGRIYIVLRMIMNSSQYASPRAFRLNQMFGCEAGYTFSMKCMFKDQPFGTMAILFTFQTIYFALALRFGESALDQEIILTGQDPMNFDSYINCIWCIIITMTTVGYGDFHPRTLIGRFLISFIAIWGIFTVSLMVIVLTSTLQLSQIEKQTLKTLDCLQKKQEQKLKAADVIRQFFNVKIQTARQEKLFKPKRQSFQYEVFQDERDQIPKSRAIKNEIGALKDRIKALKKMGRKIRVLYRKEEDEDFMDFTFDCLKDSINTVLDNSTKLQKYMNDNMYKSEKKFLRLKSQVMKQSVQLRL